MTENQKLREAFEAHMTDGGKWPNAILKAPGGQYLLLRTSVGWQDWKACAEALATTEPEPFDEREAFEKWLGIKPCGAAHDFGWSAWQARAAMAKG